MRMQALQSNGSRFVPRKRNCRYVPQRRRLELELIRLCSDVACFAKQPVDSGKLIIGDTS